MSNDQHYPIQDVEGIGASYAEKLKSAGVGNTEDLLEVAGKRAGRNALAEATGISEKLILTWVNQADLMRISGIGPQYAELLEDAGVDTVKELRTRNAENLAEKMAATNAAHKVSGSVPNASVVAKWIEAAKGMEPGVEY